MTNTAVPVEFCHVSKEYPCFLHVFQYKPDNKTEIIPRHWHQNLEISYRMHYSGCLYINGRKKELHGDSIEIINSYDVHEIHKYAGNEMTVILVSISYDFLQSIIPDYNNYYFIAGEHQNEIKRIILSMKELYESDTSWAYIKMNSLIYELIFHMMQDAEQKSQIPFINLSVNDSIKRNDLLNYIHQHIQHINSVQDLSQKLGYSREHLSRTVKQLFGINIRTLLAQIRMQETIQLSRTRGISLQKAAELTGYSSYRTFADAYRKHKDTLASRSS